MNADIRLISDANGLKHAWPVMQQLRGHLDEQRFIAQALRQMQNGYFLAGNFSEGRPVSLAGYRYIENLYAGRTMYVDDLVTDENLRGSGTAKALFDWLVKEARQHDCAQLHLDSGVQRHRAHRFYLDRGMIISSHHFQLLL